MEQPQNELKNTWKWFPAEGKILRKVCFSEVALRLTPKASEKIDMKQFNGPQEMEEHKKQQLGE